MSPNPPSVREAAISTSLKGYIPGLARHLGVTPAALYERQRALVRAGDLELAEGRGPGSGVRADCRGIALLLLAVLATDSLSQVETRTKEMSAAKWVSGRPYYLGETFLDVLEE